jgi:hypothetical protein
MHRDFAIMHEIDPKDPEKKKKKAKAKAKACDTPPASRYIFSFHGNS